MIPASHLELFSIIQHLHVRKSKLHSMIDTFEKIQMKNNLMQAKFSHDVRREVSETDLLQVVF